MGSVNCKSFKSDSVADENDCRPIDSRASFTTQSEFDEGGGNNSSLGNQGKSGMEFVEGVVCREEDLQENQMKQFELADAGKVLVVKQNGEISALGYKCTHYGAPLANGALSDGRVRCQWHGACFNIKTGDIEDFPGQDSLPCFKVTVTNGEVRVRAKRSELETSKRTKVMKKRLNGDNRTFVVIGGGPSGAICVETLRQEGFTGRVVMVCKESYLPYDRIKVSKAMDAKIDSILLRSPDFYSEHDIETMVGVEALKVDTQEQKVFLSNGFVVPYDKVYIATGCKPRKLNCEGADLSNVITLRNYTDSEITNGKLASDKHVVVLGVSFIGLEAASYCVSRVAKVTVIGRGDVPLEQSFGKEIGARVMKLFESKGIEFRMNNGLKRCLGENGVLTSVELTTGEKIKADLCIMGIGSTLYTEFLKKTSDLKINPDGSISTDLYLQTNVPNIYVGGDIANAPVYSIGHELATIGHYPLAQYHGRIAALNMCDKKTELRAVPYFWTTLFGKSFRYSGHGTPHDIKIEGSLEDLKFVAFFFDKNGKVIGVASCTYDPIVSKYAEYVSSGKTLFKKDLEPDALKWAQ